MANRFKILILVLIFVISTISILNFEKNIVIGDPQTENWSEEVKLIALNGEPNDVFGDSHSISIDGDYAVIGAYGDDNEEGSAYVFKREGNSWIQETKLTPSDGEPEDRFGGSVSLDGDYAVIGAYHDDNWKGSAYVFKREGNSWIQETKLTASDGEPEDGFGRSVSLDGDYAVIGASGDDSKEGSAYVFKREGNSWIQETKFISSYGEP